MCKAVFDELKKDDIPYLDNYRKFILSILRVCPQTRETNILCRLREESPPGYEAQVGFGQYRMKDVYGKAVRVYFFCMVPVYSRMHYVYFSRDPFTTRTAIQAHEYAFQYFGGRSYKGIDSLNCDALRWPDAEGNGTMNLRTRKPPWIMFREQRSSPLKDFIGNPFR